MTTTPTTMAPTTTTTTTPRSDRATWTHISQPHVHTRTKRKTENHMDTPGPHEVWCPGNQRLPSSPQLFERRLHSVWAVAGAAPTAAAVASSTHPAPCGVAARSALSRLAMVCRAMPRRIRAFSVGARRPRRWSARRCCLVNTHTFKLNNLTGLFSMAFGQYHTISENVPYIRKQSWMLY